MLTKYRLEVTLLWKNNGEGKFADVAKDLGAAGNQKLGAYGHTIGSCWGDLDNDGHLDLFVGNFSHPPDYQDRSQFLRNKGPKEKYHFEDMTKIAKLRWQESYASPALGDYDNDGWLDLYFTTVYAGDKSVLYRNRGAWKFEEIKDGAGLSLAQTYQAAWADFDNDGHLDMITGGKLFRNPGTKNHWLKVRLEGTGKVNRAAIGAQVRLRLGEETSQSRPALHRVPPPLARPRHPGELPRALPVQRQTHRPRRRGRLFLRRPGAGRRPGPGGIPAVRDSALQEHRRGPLPRRQ